MFSAMPRDARRPRSRDRIVKNLLRAGLQDEAIAVHLMPTTHVVSLATHDRDRVGKLANYIQPQLVGGLRRALQTEISALTQGIVVSGQAEAVVSVDAKGAVTGTSGLSENPKGSGLGILLDSTVRKAQFLPAYENGKPAAGGINVVANFARF